VIYVDTNVFMYAVGRDHPLRGEARRFFFEALEAGETLATSAETLQELLHAYVPVGRIKTLDAALALARGSLAQVWPVEPDDVLLARNLLDRNPALGARDLIHLASCIRREVKRIKTFDRALSSAF
jgi:predicted nucleic acid-binding protein